VIRPAKQISSASLCARAAVGLIVERDDRVFPLAPVVRGFESHGRITVVTDPRVINRKEIMEPLPWDPSLAESVRINSRR
jgi:hypothetical protein